MEKIIKALLKAQFPEIDIENLLEIIMATPNPQVATEIICGIYEEPVINPIKIDKGIEKKFQSFDKWTQKVHYTYQKQETRGGYFPEEITKESINIDNFDSLKSETSRNANWYNIPTGKMVEDTGYCDFSTWQ